MPLPADDLAFVREHAATYAASTAEPEAYAEWYVAKYAGGADGLEDLPSHALVWPAYQRYLDNVGPAPTGDAPETDWDAWRAHAASVAL